MTSDTQPTVKAKFQPSEKAQLVHLPTRTGPEIRIYVIVREVLPDDYVVDTPNQSGLKVRQRDLEILSLKTNA